MESVRLGLVMLCENKMHYAKKSKKKFKKKSTPKINLRPARFIISNNFHTIHVTKFREIIAQLLLTATPIYVPDKDRGHFSVVFDYFLVLVVISIRFFFALERLRTNKTIYFFVR